METLSIPPCPKCARTELTTIIAKDQYRLGEPPARRRNAKRRHKAKPVGKLYVYQCQCGTSFAHSVPFNGNAGKKISAGLRP